MPRCSTAIEDIRNAGGNFTRLEPRQFKYIERTAALKDLRFETEPVEDDREVQSVLDAQGRILGWFSWEPDHAMSNALGEMRPLAILTAIFLVGFAGIRALAGAAHGARAWRERAARLAAGA